MKRIAFHDRERETDEIMKLLDAEPSLITFIYGPINSGKTTMVSHLIKGLPDDYAPFYVNLRGRFIADYEDFLNVLFEIDEEGRVDNVTEYAKSILKDLGAVSGIPIPINLFERIFEKKDKSKDMFKYIEQFFVEISKKRTPILIIDELQVIGDLEVDDLLIYKLFNFFIRLTKEMHLAHVFAVTSDSLFIERVYNEAMLEGRCRYLMVDDFDRETTSAFLEEHGFTDAETSMAWDYFGGKPVYLIELANYEKKVAKAEELLLLRTGEIETILKRINELGGEIIIEDIKYSVSYEKLVGALKKFVDREAIDMNEVDEISKAFLVKKNTLFIDPLKKLIKPQSRLNLLAIREVVRNA
ncbi:MAG: ATP-binding protein [Candidatus Methanogaster sp.]|uniref:ATP-binding protein n=1 Tax=Candidatus Methanogaster sp. TaxID=3386292 RepID=A0AC61L1K5_9EURY|nr:MAG: ATP-binding protein [ANME-2 cluster archaeon]